MGILKINRVFYDYSASDILADNLKTWLEYGLLETGAYTTAKFNMPSTSGLTNLKRVFDERYDGINGSGSHVFEGMGPSWVWENITNVPSGYPGLFRPSGVYVNNVFFNVAESGYYSFKVDYLNGRILFNNPVPQGSSVKCEYCFRDVAIYLEDEVPWRETIQNYLNKYENAENLQPSGLCQILKDNRLWLPCIIIDAKTRDSVGIQLGGGELDTNLVVYHIFSENPSVTRGMSDIIQDQKSQTLNLFDSNKRPQTFEYDGTLSSESTTYPNLINRGSGYFWTFGAIVSSKSRRIFNISDMFAAEVAHGIEVERYLSTY